uniref:GTPase-activator protein n=1 Tax=Marseillevirus LCMAC101 TaxID=2506602 RepID=A0A481YRG9_9VIRU|nr:MAG: GTPase-activator protein [Marseillevirus LCMAC101]
MFLPIQTEENAFFLIPLSESNRRLSTSPTVIVKLAPRIKDVRSARSPSLNDLVQKSAISPSLDDLVQKSSPNCLVRKKSSEDDIKKISIHTNFHGLRYCQPDFYSTFHSLIMSWSGLASVLMVSMERDENSLFHFFRLTQMINIHSLTIERVFEYEIQNVNDECLIFRTDSFCTRLFKHFNQEIGKKYLSDIMTCFISWMSEQKFMKDVNLDCVSSQSNDASLSLIQDTQDIILEASKGFIRHIVGSIVDLPTEMISFFSNTSKKIQRKFGASSKQLFLIGCFFLRFICPALIIPEPYIDDQLDLKTKRFLIIISKIVQSVANGQPFKSDNMIFANHLIEKFENHISLILHMINNEQLGEKETQIYRVQKIIYNLTKDKYLQKCTKDEDEDEMIKWKETLKSLKNLFENNLFFMRMKIKRSFKHDTVKSREKALALLDDTKNGLQKEYERC